MSLDTESLSAVLHSLYSAAAIPNGWEQFLHSIADTIGANAAAILVRDDRAPSGGQHAVSIGIDEPYVRAYNAHYNSVNIVYEASLAVDPINYIGALQSVIDLEKYRNSEIYNDYARPQDLFYQCSALLSRQGSYTAAISLMRPERKGAYGDQHVRTLQLLAPHMRQAFELHSRLRRCEGSEAGLASALDQLETAMFLLDGSGRLQRTNTAGDRLLSAGDCLSLKGQRLCPKLQEDCAEFKRLVGLTCATGAGRGAFPGGYMLLRRSAGRPLHCKLTPFSSESAFFAASPSAILFIGDPEAAPISRSTVMRSLYRLTPAESQLADLLLTGDTVASAADRRGITEDSARTQLKSIFHKTDTKRQTDLIRLMLSVPV